LSNSHFQILRHYNLQKLSWKANDFIHLLAQSNKLNAQQLQKENRIFSSNKKIYWRCL